MNIKESPALPSSSSTQTGAARGLPPKSSAHTTTKREQILSSLDGVTVPAIRPSAAYRMAIALVAAALVVVLILFVSMLGFLSWLVGWHLYQTVVTLKMGPYLIFHLPMALLGILLLVFTLKPLLSMRRQKEATQTILRAEDEPAFFEFLRKLCESTGAPMPARVEVDCNPNAAAWRLGMFASRNQLGLRVGLPLAALPANQFAGVLAHELGHFNQRAGMTSRHLVHRLMYLLAEIVFRRDRLDQKLANLRRARHPLKRAFFWMMFLPIEAGRGLLCLMLVVSDFLSCRASRRMEYAADESEAQIAGSKGFVRTSKLLFFLSIASRRAYQELVGAWQERRLADDWVALIVDHASQLAEHKEEILKSLDRLTSVWCDSHPSHTQRVEHVEKLALPGLMKCDVSAKHLFTDFGALCRKVSADTYRLLLKENLDQAKLIPTATLALEGVENRASLKTLRRYLRGVVVGLRPVFPATSAALPVENQNELRRQLQKSRESMIALAETAVRHAEPVLQLANKIAFAKARAALNDIPGANRVMRRNSNRWNVRIAGLEQEERSLGQTLSMFEPAARDRMALALRLLQCDDVAAAVAATAVAKPETAGTKQGGAPRTAYDIQFDVMRLLDVCWALEPYVVTFLRLREQALKLRTFDNAINPQKPYAPLIERTSAIAQQMLKTLGQLSAALATVAYPFDHAVESISLGDALIVNKPANAQSRPDVYFCVLRSADRFDALTFRVLAKLSEYAERVEAAIGLPALPDPPIRGLSAAEREAASAEAHKRDRFSRKQWIAYGIRAAGGVAMMAALIFLSLFPPTLPAMQWGGSDENVPPSARYQPAAFHVSLDRNKFTGPVVRPPIVNSPQGGGSNRPPQVYVPPTPSVPGAINRPPMNNPSQNTAPSFPQQPRYHAPQGDRPPAPQRPVTGYSPPPAGGRH